MQIKKRIFNMYIEIIVILLIIPLSYLYWDKLNIEDYSKIAYSYSDYKSNYNLNFYIKNNLSSIMPIDKENVNKNNNIELIINNYSKNKQNYNLYLIYDNNSSLNKEVLKIVYNNETRYLNEFNNYTVGNYTYYIIDTNSINKNEEITEKLYIYLDENTPLSELGKSLNINFEIGEI